MKILVISNLFPPYYVGGYEVICAQTCQGLKNLNHEVVVLTSDAEGVKKTEGVEHNIRVIEQLKLYMPFDKPAPLMRRRRWEIGRYNYQVTKKVIQEERPDIVFVWSQLRLTLGPARAAQDSGVPVAYIFNDKHITSFIPAHFNFNFRSMGRYVMDNWIFPSITVKGIDFSKSICVSENVKKSLLQRGLPVHNSWVIHPAIPLEQFPPKKNMGKVPIPPKILYVGKLQPYKGVHTIIEAVNLLCEKGMYMEGLKATIVGDGPEDYKNLLKEKAQGKHFIHFLGKVPHKDLAPLYREHDIFIFPSTWEEPFGITHLEAMASGTVVVTTASGGQKEGLNDGEHALVFEKENYRQLARSILYLCEHPTFSRTLAQNARNLVERFYTLDRYVHDIEAFLLKARKKEKGLWTNKTVSSRESVVH